MNIIELMLIPLFACAMLVLPVVYVLKRRNKNSAAKKAFIVNICSFFSVLALATILPIGQFVSAETVQTVSNAIGDAGLGYIAAAVSVSYPSEVQT